MTKLFVPRVQPGLVVRTRVSKRLDEGLRRRLTLISAPPGFGKTTLVSGWIHSRVPDERCIAWLSLDERDNDTARFLTYVVEALLLASPEIGEELRSVVRSLPNVQPDQIITQLINRVGELTGQIVLVLDDYHMIEQAEIHRALDFLIEHQPPQLHVILTCRVDPPISLSRLRVRDELIDIGADELRFTAQETARFLQNVVGRDISAGSIHELEQRTEGWIAALQLAAISLRTCDDVQTFIHSFSGQHRHIVDYLVDEVLNRQPPAVQDFLLHTALFDRFSAELCDAVTERQDGYALLALLERLNLFTIPLDSERRWFRYHQLFADVLRQRLRQLQPQLIPSLRRRASVWFEEHDDPIEAAWQAINGEDWQRVSVLIKAHAQPLFNQGQSRALLRLTQAVPDEIVRSKAWLLDTRGWAQSLNGEVAGARRDLLALAELVGDQDHSNALSALERRQLRGSLAAARAMNAILENDFDATLAFGDGALQQLPEDALRMRSMIEVSRAQAHWLVGDLQSSIDASWRGIELSRQTDAPLFRIIGLLSVGSTEVEWGELEHAAEIYEQAVGFAGSHGLANWQFLGRVLSFQSEVPYERNDLETALTIAAHGRELTGAWSTSYAYDVTHLQLARIHYARCDLDGARAALEQSPSYSGMGPGAAVVAQVEALKALVALEAGDRSRLIAVEQELLKLVAEIPADRIWLWTPALKATGQVLNAIGRPADGVSILAPLFETCIERGWLRQAIQSGAVLALSYLSDGRQEAAARTFERVLADAEPRGFLRSILDAGPGIGQVIEATRTRRREAQRDSVYLNRLLKLAREDRQRQPGQARTSKPGLIEPLSARELEVLSLIAAGYTNAEAADELFVAVGTVKAHASNIYTKLGVRSRTRAVSRARELGLVD